MNERKIVFEIILVNQAWNVTSFVYRHNKFHLPTVATNEARIRTTIALTRATSIEIYTNMYNIHTLQSSISSLSSSQFCTVRPCITRPFDLVTFSFVRQHVNWWPWWWREAMVCARKHEHELFWTTFRKNFVHVYKRTEHKIKNLLLIYLMRIKCEITYTRAHAQPAVFMCLHIGYSRYEETLIVINVFRWTQRPSRWHTQINVTNSSPLFFRNRFCLRVFKRIYVKSIQSKSNFKWITKSKWIDANFSLRSNDKILCEIPFFCCCEIFIIFVIQLRRYL